MAENYFFLWYIGVNTESCVTLKYKCQKCVCLPVCTPAFTNSNIDNIDYALEMRKRKQLRGNVLADFNLCLEEAGSIGLSPLMISFVWADLRHTTTCLLCLTGFTKDVCQA